MNEIEVMLGRLKFENPPEHLRARIVRDARERLRSRPLRSVACAAACAVAIAGLVWADATFETHHQQRVEQILGRPVGKAPSHVGRDALPLYAWDTRLLRRLSDPELRRQLKDLWP